MLADRDCSSRSRFLFRISSRVQNLLNVLRSSSYLVIIAAGQMLVLIVGGFDLSQGAVVALTSVSAARWSWSA